MLFCSVKSITAILLLSVYLITATGFGELLKMSMLIDHYNQHCKSCTSLSFLDFMEMHYVTDDLNADDNTDDKKLPFKSPEVLLDIITQDLICYHSPSVFKSLELISGTFTIPLEKFQIKHYHPNVWHPPQLS